MVYKCRCHKSYSWLYKGLTIKEIQVVKYRRKKNLLTIYYQFKLSYSQSVQKVINIYVLPELVGKAANN